MSLYTDLDTLGSGGSNITFACDLSGTPTCQTVIGLQGNEISSQAPTDGQILQWNDSASQWQPTTVGITFTAGGDLSGTSSSQTVIGIQSRSVLNSAPSDNQTLVWITANNRWEPTTLTFSGDISGTYPSPSVDKIHGTSVPATPSANQVLVATSGTTAIWSQILDGYVAAGAGIAYSKLNLSNSIVNADVNSSAAIDVSKLAAGTAAQVLLNNSTPTPTWTSISQDISISNTGVVTLEKLKNKTLDTDLASVGASQDGYVLTWINADAEWQAKPTAGTVTFAGDLSGTLTSQTVEKIKGTTITTAGGSLATGAVLRVTGAASADWGALDLADTDAVTGVLPTGNQAAQTMAGDVTGTTAASVVEKIRTKTLDADLATIGATEDGYVLTWINGSSEWQAKPTAASVTFAGDLSGNSSSQTVEKIKGTTITTAGGALPVGAVLRTTAVGTADWGQLDLADTDAVTGVLPKANQAAQDMAGDVTGTTAASVVEKINGTSVPATPNADEVLVATSGTVGDWAKIVNANVDASAAIAYSKLNLSGSIVNADVNASAAIAVSKLAAGTAGQILLNNATPTPTWTTVSGDATISNAGAVTLQSIKGKTLDTDLSSIGAGQDQYVLTWDNAAAEWQAKAASGGAPTGSAGGDLNGTYPNPTVKQLTGLTNVVTVLCPTIRFDTGVNGNLNCTSTSSGAGNALTISAGATTAASQTGGELFLTGGAGNASTGTAGNVVIATNVASASGNIILRKYDSSGTPTDIATFAPTTTTIVNPSTIGSTTGKNQLNGGMVVTTFLCNSSLTIGDGYRQINVDTSAARSITLPSPATAGREIYISDITGSANTNNITLVRFGSEKIAGIAASKILQTDWGSWRIWSNGTDWFVDS